MSIRARTVALLLVVSGCDIVHHQRQPSPARERVAPKVEETRRDASGDRSGLLACYDDCKRQGLDDTDLATCRNNCEAAFKVAPTPADLAFDRAARCIHRCDDSRPCVARCKRRARKADATLTNATLNRLSACIDGCEADRGLDEGDRWTCVRNCAMTTRRPAPGA